MVGAVAVRRAEVSARDTRTLTPEPREDDYHLWEIKHTCNITEVASKPWGQSQPPGQWNLPWD